MSSSSCRPARPRSWRRWPPPARPRLRRSRPPGGRAAGCSRSRGLVDVADEHRRLGGDQAQAASSAWSLPCSRGCAGGPASFSAGLAPSARSPGAAPPCRRRTWRLGVARQATPRCPGRPGELGLDDLDVGDRVDLARPTWMTFSSSKQRTTLTIASVSRMWARNWLPGPRPCSRRPPGRRCRRTRRWPGTRSGLTIGERARRGSGTSTDADVGLDGAER